MSGGAKLPLAPVKPTLQAGPGWGKLTPYQRPEVALRVKDLPFKQARERRANDERRSSHEPHDETTHPPAEARTQQAGSVQRRAHQARAAELRREVCAGVVEHIGHRDVDERILLGQASLRLASEW